MNGTSIYEERGVPTVINAVGTRTQVGGSRMAEPVREAMARASERFVYMTELQAHASRVIADATGAAAGLVTAGAAAGLTLGVAACIAGDDYDAMRRLPHGDDLAAEVVMPKAHRFKYDVAIRAAGARIVDVGIVSHHPVEGGVDVVEPWELEAAITERTAAVAYLARPYNRLSLDTVVDVAHDHDVPVVVDAAGELPPKANLRRFVERGADLVSYSGGKVIGGPQSTGILAGRRDLVRSAALQHLSDGYHEELWDPPSEFIDASALPGVPPNGIGRPIKVCKEEVVGLLCALERFVEDFDDEAYFSAIDRRVASVVDGLSDLPGVAVSVTNEDDPTAASRVHLRLDRDRAVLSAVGLLERLRREEPRIWLGENRTHLGEVYVDVRCLTDDELEHLVDRVRHHLTGEAG